MRRKSPASNLMEMYPILKEKYQLEYAEGQPVWFLLLPRTSWFERQSVRFLKQPRVIRIELDELGGTVLSMCNGDHTVQAIAERLALLFGAKAEPLLPRLVKFIEILEANGWVYLQDRPLLVRSI